MNQNRPYPSLWTILALIGLLLLAAWAPWIDQVEAERRAVDAFTASWEGVIDGCGVNCQGCGAVRAERALFGWNVEIEYACGLIPADTPEYHQRAAGFVSFAGTVSGLPRP